MRRARAHTGGAGAWRTALLLDEAQCGLRVEAAPVVRGAPQDVDAEDVVDGVGRPVFYGRFAQDQV